MSARRALGAGARGSRAKMPGQGGTVQERLGHVLAEANVALPRAPVDAPEMAAFVRAFDDVNWLADRSEGFVWRLPGEVGPFFWGRLDDRDVLVTLSLWVDYTSLQRFVFRTAHGLFMRQRARWFVPVGGLTTVLWWVPADHRPTAEEGLDRLRQLRSRGPTREAFSLRRQFGPDGTAL